jgi:dCMP deaminase
MIGKWDRRFLKLAEFVARWSKDPSTQTGAVIASPDNRLVSVGFNGFPKGVADNHRLNDRDTKYQLIVHCETNAVLLAGRSVEGATLYTWPFGSCTPCAARMIQAGIKRVVAPACPADKYERWGADLGRAASLFIEAGVETWVVPPEDLM